MKAGTLKEDPQQQAVVQHLDLLLSQLSEYSTAIRRYKEELHGFEVRLSSSRALVSLNGRSMRTLSAAFAPCFAPCLLVTGRDHSVFMQSVQQVYSVCTIRDAPRYMFPNSRTTLCCRSGGKHD